MAPFRQFTFKAKAYVSWVGLRGAVPIIFATYALMSPQVVHARFMFNIVFFITILSLLIQGTTVNTMAKWLGLDEVVDKKIFNVELPEEIDAVMHEQTITASDLADEMFLSEMTIPEQTLVIFIKRGDKYIVPKGNTRIYIGDKLLLISDLEKLAKA